MSDAHHCRALVLTCMDWRLHTAVEEALRGRIGGPFDLVCVAGASKPVAEGAASATGRYVLDHVETSARLHAIRRVLLVHHTDCGAYGGSTAFADAAEERTRHERDMATTAQVLRQRFPDLEITRHLAVLSHQGDTRWKVEVHDV